MIYADRERLFRREAALRRRRAALLRRVPPSLAKR
jgi:hypothetical protein